MPKAKVERNVNMYIDGFRVFLWIFAIIAAGLGLIFENIHEEYNSMLAYSHFTYALAIMAALWASSID